ncbi:MAG: YicC family protein, partial [Phycisphaerales bacterium]|nr:YicC family protein [Phycisphaerales bacterium]
ERLAMIRSMTGFGAATADADGTHFAVELRSLNNKYFKAVIRLPEELQGLEAELESALSHRLTRGSVVMTVRWSDASAAAAARINVDAVQRYLEQVLSIPGLEHNAARIDLGALLALPGVLVADTGEKLLERARPVLLRLADEASDRLVAMRIREGESLHEELHRHRLFIGERLEAVAGRAPQVVEQYQERLQQRVNALLAEVGSVVREEDLIREVAIYAERSDIAEEISRLQGHLDQFQEIIDSAADEPAGRTLDFLSQEMLREANTIASKSSDSEISRRIVEIKGAIDRIKEQAQNVE